jgi:hypothetical protein
VVLSPAVRTSGIFLVVDLLRCGRRVLTPPGIVTVTFANRARLVGWSRHQQPVSLFDRSTVSPSRPGFGEAPRAAAVKTGRSAAPATAEGAREAVLTMASTGPDWAGFGA